MHHTDTTLAQRQEAVPLKAWGCCCTLLAILYLTIQLFSSHLNELSYAKTSFQEVNSVRLHQFETAFSQGDKRSSVILLGTSLTRYATYWEDDSEYQKKYGPVALLNISYAGGIFDDFSSLLKQITAIAPDIVIVQDDLLRTDPANSGIWRLRKIWKTMVTNAVGEWKTQAVSKEIRTPLEAEWYHQKSRQSFGKRLPINEKKLASIKKCYLETNRLPLTFLQFARAIEQAGSHLIILHISRHQDFHRLYDAELQSYHKIIRTELNEIGHVPLWTSPDNYDLNDYWDHSHLSGRGREKFTPWLMKRLQTTLQQQSVP